MDQLENLSEEMERVGRDLDRIAERATSQGEEMEYLSEQVIEKRGPGWRHLAIALLEHRTGKTIETLLAEAKS